eukprot:412167-Amphidinium_carterae.1
MNRWPPAPVKLGSFETLAFAGSWLAVGLVGPSMSSAQPGAFRCNEGITLIINFVSSSDEHKAEYEASPDKEKYKAEYEKWAAALLACGTGMNS